jgi:hypothetical protein
MNYQIIHSNVCDLGNGLLVQIDQCGTVRAIAHIWSGTNILEIDSSKGMSPGVDNPVVMVSDLPKIIKLMTEEYPIGINYEFDETIKVECAIKQTDKGLEVYTWMPDGGFTFESAYFSGYYNIKDHTILLDSRETWAEEWPAVVKTIDEFRKKNNLGKPPNTHWTKTKPKTADEIQKAVDEGKDTAVNLFGPSNQVYQSQSDEKISPEVQKEAQRLIDEKLNKPQEFPDETKKEAQEAIDKLNKMKPHEAVLHEKKEEQVETKKPKPIKRKKPKLIKK